MKSTIYFSVVILFSWISSIFIMNKPMNASQGVDSIAVNYFERKQTCQKYLDTIEVNQKIIKDNIKITQQTLQQ